MPELDRPCCVCHNTFTANKFSGSRQVVCQKAECRREVKRRRQASWLERNPDYFQGPENVERVREWRRKNPGWRERKKCVSGKSRTEAESCNREEAGEEVLQDSASGSKDPVLVGFMAFMTGAVLQDEVQNLYGECFRRGHELLRPTGAEHDSPTTNTEPKADPWKNTRLIPPASVTCQPVSAG
jgi:hypothetical protein